MNGYARHLKCLIYPKRLYINIFEARDMSEWQSIFTGQCNAQSLCRVTQGIMISTNSASSRLNIKCDETYSFCKIKHFFPKITFAESDILLYIEASGETY